MMPSQKRLNPARRPGLRETRLTHVCVSCVCGTAGTVQWGCRLAGLRKRGRVEGGSEGGGGCCDSVEAQFENGESFVFDLVIGADGIREC